MAAVENGATGSTVADNKAKEMVLRPNAAKTQIPMPGRIVLVKLSDGTERPMLIVRVKNMTTVNGIIFLDGWDDRHLAIPGIKEGALLSRVKDFPRGNGPGEWHFYNE